MKLEEHVERIRLKVEDAVKNTLDRCGITEATGELTFREDSNIEIGNARQLIESIQADNKDWTHCYNEIVDDYAFTLFNRLVCMKVLESYGLYPEMITQREQHSGKSYGHFMWLESNPSYRDDAFEGLKQYLGWQFEQLSGECDLFNTDIPLHMVPTSVFCKEIIDLINAVDADDQVDDDIWKQGNVLSRIYEIYNNSKKAELKASGEKVEYDKVSVQSQIYTPEWVVKFLVDNSLGKMYLEMYPDSEIKNEHKIIGDYSAVTREVKPLDEIKVIDPCVGSGNFLLYCFDLLYEMYMDQIDNYGADYSKRAVPQLIIEKNLHGIDLDERAVQLTKVGLFIKAKIRRNSVHIDHYNVVSASFRLPEYSEIGTLFDVQFFSKQFGDLLKDVWKDLQQAHKFGSLLRIDEKFEEVKNSLKEDIGDAQLSLFTYQKASEFDLFANNFYEKLGEAISKYAINDKKRFYAETASNALMYLKLITGKYDVVVSNPPYTDSGDFGTQLLKFSKENYVKGCKSNGNLYSMFVYRNIGLTMDNGFTAFVHPHTIMTIKTYSDVRKYILSKTGIELFVDYGLDRVNLFGPKILVEAVFYILRNAKINQSVFFNIDKNQQEKTKKGSLEQCINDIRNGKQNDRVFVSDQEDFKLINGMPFVYELSDTFKEQFKKETIGKIGYPVLGLKTSDNKKYLRYWWELSHVNDAEWPFYAKGGDFNRWYGNNWLRVDWRNDGASIKAESHSQMIEKGWEFKEGVTVSTRSVKGSSSRFLSKNMLFDMAASSIISLDSDDTMFILGFSNSKVFSFVLETLNNTVNKQPQDLRRIPLGDITDEIKTAISEYSAQCVHIKKEICRLWSTEPEFSKTIIENFYEDNLEKTISKFINYYNLAMCSISAYEALINKAVYKMYSLPNKDIELIEDKCGCIVADIPVSKNAKQAFLKECSDDVIKRYVQEIDEIETFNSIELTDLYKPNNDVIDFSELHQINPIDIWFALKNNTVDVCTIKDKIVLDFLCVLIKDALIQSETGILSVKKIGTEDTLRDKIIKLLEKKNLSRILPEIELFLGEDIDNYLQNLFMQRFSNYLNLFMYLPQTPYIWQMTSDRKTISLYCYIHKIDNNFLYRIKNYASKKVDQLEFSYASIGNEDTAEKQIKKENVSLQIADVRAFISKIDMLIAKGYEYNMEKGVAANIAPIQNLGLISSKVLSDKQMEYYLEV